MAGSIRQTYNELTGAEINPVSESDAIEWTPNRAFNLTQIIQTLQSYADSLATAIDDLSNDVVTNSANIATNASNISSLSTAVATKANDSEVVKLTGTQTISGIKTFSALPLAASDPTSASQLVRKNYVDNLAAGKLDTGLAVLLSGAQNIDGVKTFIAIPVLPASDPTTDNQAVRKLYVDAIDNRKQDKLIAGDNITIAADGKTISATGGGGIGTETDPVFTAWRNNNTSMVAGNTAYGGTSSVGGGR